MLGLLLSEEGEKPTDKITLIHDVPSWEGVNHGGQKVLILMSIIGQRPLLDPQGKDFLSSTRALMGL